MAEREALAASREAEREEQQRREEMDHTTKAHLEACDVACGETVVGIGLWGDGAPCNWDRTETLEVFAWNILGLQGFEHTRAHV